MSTPRRWWSSTIRGRLTLLYAGAFFLAGAALVALTYFSLGQVISHELTVRGDIAEQTLGHQSPEVHDALRAQFQRARDNTLQRTQRLACQEPSESASDDTDDTEQER